MTTSNTAIEKPTMKDLRRRFPTVFGKQCKPLRVGIFEDLVAAFGANVSRPRLSGLLKSHTNSRPYLEAIIRGGPR